MIFILLYLLWPCILWFLLYLVIESTDDKPTFNIYCGFSFVPDINSQLVWPYIPMSDHFNCPKLGVFIYTLKFVVLLPHLLYDLLLKSLQKYALVSNYLQKILWFCYHTIVCSWYYWIILFPSTCSCSNFWYSNFGSLFLSDGSVTVESSRYRRVSQIWIIGVYKKLNWIRDILKTHVHLVFSFYPWCEINCTCFIRSCWCPKMVTEENLRLLEFYDAQWCFLSFFTLVMWHRIHWIY